MCSCCVVGLMLPVTGKTIQYTTSDFDSNVTLRLTMSQNGENVRQARK